MSSWGATDADESKPKFLTDAEKKLVFANTSGWVLEAGSAFSGNDNTSATPEVLVAIGDLTTSLGAADTNANDVLKVVANPVSLNGGAIKDEGTNTVSTISSSVAIGTAAGTLTVAA